MAPSRPYDGGHGAGDGPSPQCTARGACGGGAKREGEANETHEALRRQSTPHPETRLAPLSEVAGPQRSDRTVRRSAVGPTHAVLAGGATATTAPRQPSSCRRRSRKRRRRRRRSRSGRTRRLRSTSGQRPRRPSSRRSPLRLGRGRGRKGGRSFRRLPLQVVDVPVIINDELQQSKFMVPQTQF